MTARLLLACAVAIIAPTIAFAQVPPPPDVLSSVRPDLFRAAPDTYVPKPQEELRLFFPNAASPWPIWMVERAPEQTIRIVVEHVTLPPAPVAAPAVPAATFPAAQPLVPAGHKRTLYVIPGCYAGDKLPRADQLRAGCSLGDVRTVSPVL